MRAYYLVGGLVQEERKRNEKELHAWSVGFGVRTGCGFVGAVLLLREDLGAGLMEHRISVVPGDRPGLVQAVCSCKKYRSSSYTRDCASRAQLAGDAHVWAREIEARKEALREAKEKNAAVLARLAALSAGAAEAPVAVPKGVGGCWCGRHACACVEGCTACTGCACSCECYVCGR